MSTGLATNSFNLWSIANTGYSDGYYDTSLGNRPYHSTLFHQRGSSGISVPPCLQAVHSVISKISYSTLQVCSPSYQSCSIYRVLETNHLNLPRGQRRLFQLSTLWKARLDKRCYCSFIYGTKRKLKIILPQPGPECVKAYEG